jgi:hypothetical protein
MRPFDIYDIEQLRLAHARAEELAETWRTANFGRTRKPRSNSPAIHVAWKATQAARAAAGRALIGAGRRVLPVESEPCA